MPSAVAVAVVVAMVMVMSMAMIMVMSMAMIMVMPVRRRRFLQCGQRGEESPAGGLHPFDGVVETGGRFRRVFPKSPPPAPHVLEMLIVVLAPMGQQNPQLLDLGIDRHVRFPCSAGPTTMVPRRQSMD